MPEEVIVKKTAFGTPYLIRPYAVLLSKPKVEICKAKPFVESLGFDDDYFQDDPLDSDATALCKFAGQLCYLSFGKKRTKNKDANKYFSRILEQGHGSVLEHANFTFLLFGISRSLTHELVRHRAGFAYSQVSQRYVGADRLRFVERPEFQQNDYLHHLFEARIDSTAARYSTILHELRTAISQGKGTEHRKRLRQAARAVLTNEVEAPIVVTGNVRAWRHLLQMRGSVHAEVEFRRLAKEIAEVLVDEAPELFQDISIAEHEDGYPIVQFEFPKV